MRIDWSKEGWRTWANGFGDPPVYETHPSLAPMLVRFMHTPDRGWLEPVDMAEMTELEALKVRFADKQTALEDAIATQGQMLATIRALKDGTLPVERVVITANGYQIVPAVEALAEEIAREATSE